MFLLLGFQPLQPKSGKWGQVLSFAFLHYYLLVRTFDGNLSSFSRVVKHLEKRDEQCWNVRPDPMI